MGNLGGGLINITLVPSTVPVSLESDGIFFHSISRGLSGQAIVTVHTYKNENLMQIARNADGTSPEDDAQPINKNARFSIELSSPNSQVDFMYQNASHGEKLMLPFTIIHVPDTIRLKLRVFLEGALPRR